MDLHEEVHPLQKTIVFLSQVHGEQIIYIGRDITLSTRMQVVLFL